MATETKSTRFRHELARFGKSLLSLLFVLAVVLFGLRYLANLFSVPAQNGWHPTWSPDGRYIAFTSNYSGCESIYRMDSDGSNRIQLTFNRWQRLIAFCILNDRYAAWSPDGEKIAFVSDRKSPLWKKDLDIYVMNANGSGIRRLTKHSGNSPLAPGAACAYPAWSPDGKMLAFVCQAFDYSTESWDPPAMYLMNADGANLHKLLDIDANDFEWPVISPSWSPDGRSLNFVQVANNRFEIFSVNVDGTEKKQLTRNFYLFSNAAWSPDGSKILFVGVDQSTNPPAGAYFYMMNADGTHPTKVARFEGAGSSYVAWSPDGTRIAFVDDNTHSLHIMHADGSNVLQLTGK